MRDFSRSCECCDIPGTAHPRLRDNGEPGIVRRRKSVALIQPNAEEDEAKPENETDCPQSCIESGCDGWPCPEVASCFTHMTLSPRREQTRLSFGEKQIVQSRSLTSWRQLASLPR